ncbi:TPA: hypothetical protein ACXPX3_005575 [Klebsiella variicola subsp. variicola]|uniref:Uncharacterized protein n=1 Tax=Siccibacter colletis TaxID=1505757 RepID=A0ABY6JM69_9ENTR|nr:MULTISPECIES: hypothetical protein [Enterobacteriaceae]EAU3347050.1 hypothetical protein [Salmonella enterica]ECD6934066.1 hypothetical protein [Salmonella enterica subsp. enterica serovar Saintpaul]ELC7447338.1 hypothetical protein [Enterobacter hormaechei]HAS1075171.1 hypothetical protein [Enterobacter cloacae]HDT1561727.1 hypothetical protein [Klebsiella pneumoniae subsp. pneumoniae]HDT5221774.1 hypothetical protein [Enterobacter roggenkampii]HDV8512059.1 hypothetical protein [Escheric
MRKLQFTAHCEKHNPASPQSNDCDTTQAYVADLLAQQLEQYGFKTQNICTDSKQLSVSVENHPLPLSVTCRKKSENGLLMCEISSHPEEEQDWFSRIEMQSVIKQLAQAVENTLKQDKSFAEFEWKS